MRCSWTWNMFTWREHVHINGICSHEWNTFTWRKYVHMKGIRSHEWNTFTWMEYVHTNGIRSHEWNTFIWMEYVHMKEICSHEWNMFTWRNFVHMNGIRSHEWNMFTWMEYVHMNGICSHEGNMFTWRKPEDYSRGGESIKWAKTLMWISNYEVKWIAYQPSMRSFEAIGLWICSLMHILAHSMYYTLVKVQLYAVFYGYGWLNILYAAIIAWWQ